MGTFDLWTLHQHQYKKPTDNANIAKPSIILR